MPNQFQPFNLNKDIVSTKTLLHEAIPLTGTIYKFGTGSYLDTNIKNFSHGQFQAVYDYPYLSSSANHIFDITVGFDETSEFLLPKIKLRKERLVSQSLQVLGLMQQPPVT
jgi:hypothetical protein